MDEKDLEITNAQQNEENNSANSVNEADRDESLEERNGVKYETNDNWQFEAEAHSLTDNDIILEESVIGDDIPQKDEMHNNADSAGEDEEQKSVSQDSADNNGGKIVVDKSLFKIIPLVLAVFLVAGALVFLGIRYYTVPNGKEGKLMNPGSVVATVDGYDVSIGMYNYYYTSVVNYYESYAGYGYYELDTSKDYDLQYTTDDDGNKISWSEFFKNETMEEIKTVTTGYNAGLKDGIKLTSVQKKTIDEQIKNLKNSASQQEVSLAKYLKNNFGEYCTESTIRLMLEQYYLNALYRGEYKLKQQITQDDIDNYYSKNKNDYYTINFSYIALEYDTTSDKAKAESENKAKEYMAKIKDRDSIADLVPEVYKAYIESDAKAAMESDESLSKKDAIKEATKTYLSNIDGTVTGSDTPFGEKINEWLFSDDTKIGSTNYYIDSNYGYIYVILKTENATRLDDETYTVRHILICPDIDKLNNSGESGEKVTFTDDQWTAAKKKADSIFKQYNDGDKTEQSFALLAEENSDDTASTTVGSSDNFGGLCEATALGKMVPEFEKWSVDDSRKYGDVGIVKSDYGYHIMFFVNDCPQYRASIITSIKNEAVSKMNEKSDLRLHNSVIEKAIETAASSNKDNTSQTAQ